MKYAVRIKITLVRQRMLPGISRKHLGFERSNIPNDVRS